MSGDTGVVRPKRRLDAADIDVIKLVQAHLRALWHANNPWVDEHSLRAASAPLRFLLVEGNLVRAWKALRLGGPIEIEAYCFASVPGPDSVGFCGGADILPGIPVSMGHGTDVQLEVKRLNIDAFLNGPCIWAKGIRINRRELVQYIANTKGGTHYDPEGRSPRSQGIKFSLLRDLENGLFGLGVRFNGRNLVHHELSSILQALLRSREIHSLQAAVLA